MKKSFSMKNKFCFTIILSLLFLTFSANSIFAAASVGLSPATGVISSNGTSIEIVVDSQGEEVNGIELTLEYEGDISFTGFNSGNIPGCQVDGLERESFGDVFIYCFIMEDPYTGTSGVFATLDFVATAQGTGTVTITSAIGSEELTIGAPGSYTTTMAATATPETEEAAVLPQASFSSTVVFFVGLLSLLIPVFWFMKPNPTPSTSMLQKVGG